MTIKKHIIGVLTATLFGVAVGRASVPVYFQYSWNEAGVLGSDWESTQSGKTVAGKAGEIIDGVNNWTTIQLPDGKFRAVSCSTTSEGGAVNISLLSPSIEIPKDGGVMSFKLINYNPDGNFDNKYSIYIFPADCEVDTESTEPILSGRIKANNYLSPEIVTASLEGWEGKTVKLVIINQGNNAGLLGVEELKLGLYDYDFINNTPYFITKAGALNPNLTIGYSGSGNFFTVSLESESGKEQKHIEIKPGQFYYNIDFSTKLSVNDNKTTYYTVTISPENQIYPFAVKEYSISCGPGYERVIVEEEATGVNCGYCPMGAVGLEVFSSLYEERFIGIGVHCTSLSTSALRSPIYAQIFENNKKFNISSLPSAVINRKKQTSPTAIKTISNEIDSMIDSPTPVKVEISRVDCNSETSKVSVDFDVISSIEMINVELSAAVVLLADDLVGYTREWYQSDYYSGMERPSEMDDLWWSFASFYYNYPSGSISPVDKRFNHVAMGIYPDYFGNGAVLSSNWTSGEAFSHKISFDMPMQSEENGFGVQNVDKTAVVVMIMDYASGEILAADKVDANDYNKEITYVISHVNEPNEDSLHIYNLNGLEVDPHNVSPGIYIKKQGNKVEKIFINQ